MNMHMVDFSLLYAVYYAYQTHAAIVKGGHIRIILTYVAINTYVHP